MPHALALNLTDTTDHAANDDTPCKTTALLDPRENKVLVLHATGMSRRKIMEATGETEHFVRRVT